MKTILLLLIATTLAWPIAAGDPTPTPRAITIPVDANTLLEETELRVMLQQYERTLTSLYEAKLQMQLLVTRSGRDKQEGEEHIRREAEGAALQIKVLTNWNDELRQRIQMCITSLNERALKKSSKESAAPPAGSKH